MHDVLQKILGWDDLTLEQRQIVFYVCGSGDETVLLNPEVALNIGKACAIQHVPIPKAFVQELAQRNQWSRPNQGGGPFIHRLY